MENRKKYGTQEWSNFFNSLHLTFFHMASDNNSLDAKILKSLWSLFKECWSTHSHKDKFHLLNLDI